MKPLDTSEAIRQFLLSAVRAAEILSLRSNLPIDHSDVEGALLLALKLNSPADLLDRELTTDKVLTILDDFDFQRLFPTLLDVVRFERSIIPDETRRRLTEVTVRANGEVWRIHKNDADPFPSNPHAHNQENGLKLHLGTGELYFNTRKTGQRVTRKDLRAIRTKLSKFTLPAMTR